MGGGIFSENYQYTDPLPPNRIPPPTGTATGAEIAYHNLNLTDITFNGNTANILWQPPINRAALSILGFSTTSQPIFIVDNMRHPLNNYDINYRSDEVFFGFYKTDHHGTLLPGAHFRVFRTSATNLGTSDNYLVTNANSSGINPLWVEVIMNLSISQSGVGALPVSFFMSSDYTYQLVEIQVPSGFQRPMGQWRITIDDTEPGGFKIDMIGNVTIPGFTFAQCNCVGDVCDGCDRFYLANWPKFELPLAGASGFINLIFTVTGASVLLLAIVVAGLIYVSKHKTYKNAISNPYRRRYI